MRRTLSDSVALGAAMVLSLLLCACASHHRGGHAAATPPPEPPDPFALYKESHPAEAALYTHVYPVDFKSYQALDQIRSDNASDIVLVMKQKFSDVPGFSDYADRLLKVDDQMWKNVQRNIVELGEACAPGAALYEFEWSDGLKVETGLLVVKEDRIVKRQVWTSRDVTPPARQ
jgi:hypothetical protein